MVDKIGADVTNITLHLIGTYDASYACNGTGLHHGEAECYADAYTVAARAVDASKAFAMSRCLFRRMGAVRRGARAWPRRRRDSCSAGPQRRRDAPRRGFRRVAASPRRAPTRFPSECDAYMAAASPRLAPTSSFHAGELCPETWDGSECGAEDYNATSFDPAATGCEAEAGYAAGALTAKAIGVNQITPWATAALSDDIAFSIANDPSAGGGPEPGPMPTWIMVAGEVVDSGAYATPEAWAADVLIKVCAAYSGPAPAGCP